MNWRGFVGRETLGLVRIEGIGSREGVMEERSGVGGGFEGFEAVLERWGR